MYIYNIRKYQDRKWCQEKGHRFLQKAWDRRNCHSICGSFFFTKVNAHPLTSHECTWFKSCSNSCTNNDLKKEVLYQSVQSFSNLCQSYLLQNWSFVADSKRYLLSICSNSDADWLIYRKTFEAVYQFSTEVTYHFVHFTKFFFLIKLKSFVGPVLSIKCQSSLFQNVMLMKCRCFQEKKYW